MYRVFFSANYNMCLFNRLSSHYFYAMSSHRYTSNIMKILNQMLRHVMEARVTHLLILAVALQIMFISAMKS